MASDSRQGGHPPLNLTDARALDELVGLGTLTTPAARFLEVCVEVGLNVIVAGGTQAGSLTSC